VAAGALAALAPGGAALVVSARPTELLTAMRNALASSSTHDDADAGARADVASSYARLAASLAAARVVALNAGGAGVLILRRA
jgi:hypothetical protein